jgi:hypothetical protein
LECLRLGTAIGNPAKCGVNLLPPASGRREETVDSKARPAPCQGGPVWWRCGGCVVASRTTRVIATRPRKATVPGACLSETLKHQFLLEGLNRMRIGAQKKPPPPQGDGFPSGGDRI